MYTKTRDSKSYCSEYFDSHKPLVWTVYRLSFVRQCRLKISVELSERTLNLNKKKCEAVVEFKKSEFTQNFESCCFEASYTGVYFTWNPGTVSIRVKNQ